MDIYEKFNNYDFIKLDELNIFPETKIVVLYARFMNNNDIGWTFETHSHSFYEFHIPLSGHCDMIIKDSEKAVLEKGTSLLIYPGTNHKFTKLSEDFFRLSFAFDIQRNDSILLEEDKYIFNKSSASILHYMEQIANEFTSRQIGYENIMKANMQSILINYLRENPVILSESNNIRKQNPGALSNAFTFIRNNISFKITAKDVADGVNLSLRQLNRIFTSSINITVSKFILNERISHTKEYLKKTDISLREIASLTGFNDEYVLCKVFRNITGTTPGKYRLNHRKDS